MKIFEKKDLTLKKGGKKIHIKEKSKAIFEAGDAYVKPSTDSIGSMGSDINKSKTQNPSSSNFTVDLSSYDGNSNNNPVALDINAKNGSEAQKQIKQTVAAKPQLKSMMNKGELQANVHMRNENISKMRENAIPFTKKEITELLKK